MIRYETAKTITAEQFVAVLRRSGLAERRPVDDAKCMAEMLARADLLVTAWDGDELVGIARSVTDFVYCCYLSDLAVDRRLQRRGIGRELMARTQAQLGARCKIILLSAPDAKGYYPRIGLERHESTWILPREKQLHTRAEQADRC